MWATYFLPGKTLRLLQTVVLGDLAAAPGWTLVPRSVDLAGPAVRPVNASYQLLHTTDAPTSTTADGLGATVDVEIDPVPPGSTHRDRHGHGDEHRYFGLGPVGGRGSAP